MILSEKDKLEYIKKYNQGMTIYEASKIYGVSERTIQRYEKHLRNEGLIGYRDKLNVELDDNNPLDIKVSSNRIFKIENISKESLNNIRKKIQLDWKIKKSKKYNKNNKPFKIILVTSDYHIPEHNEPAIKSILKLCDDISFDGFYIVGDFLDMTPISHWLHDKKRYKTLESLRLKKDFIVGNIILDEFDKRLPKKCDKRFWFGNHECWIYDLEEKYPQLEGFFNIKEELHLEERGYIVYEKENHIERVGRLSIAHGIYCGVNYLKKHLESFATNVMIGHLHKLRVRTSSSPAKELAAIGYSIPCLCNINPDYMKNKPNEWVHGFGVLYLYKNGYFDVDLKRIIRGKFIFNGKEYDGNK